METGEVEEGSVIDSEQEIDLEEDQPQGEEHGEEGSEASEGAEETGGDEGEGEEETVVSIGTEEPPTSEGHEGETPVFADLRKRYRETSRELQQLKARLQQGQPATQQQVPQVRKEPTLEDHDFDAEAFSADLKKWYAEKGEADRKTAEIQAAQRQAQEAQQKAVQAVQQRYTESKAALKVKDFKEAEDEVVASFSDWQQGIAAKTKQPAAIVYALGKNQKKLTELAAIKDPVEFAFAMGVLQTEIKVTTRKATNKPAPETTVRGSSSGSNSKATLERLEAEADRTGDRSKVIAYKRAQRLAQSKK